MWLAGSKFPQKKGENERTAVSSQVTFLPLLSSNPVSLTFKKRGGTQEFPGGLVVRTWCLYAVCWGPCGCFVFIFFTADFFCLFFFLFFFFLLFKAAPKAYVPRLGFQFELQLPAYATTTATPDPSHVCNYTIAHSNAGSLTH